ncbi:dicarboxylate/amino acid:cation symporter [Hoylesella oralis]|uniref:dicarboxylate/amino acid:cation symporter n=1 Tax=Hoylesella oralis TaxID=28134 RepID=UPI0028E50B04|nr:dicarboxylate/amino acid:cation symporter [Hoylesella oralis]
MKKIRIGLLPRILVAILLGVLSGQVLSLQWVRIFATFNAVFGQFLGFMIPLIIVGLVAPAIADIGKSAGKLLVITVVIAYVDTVFSGLLAYGTGSWLFPDMIAGASEVTDVGKATAIEPYFTVSIPPILDVMAALVFTFMVGLGIAYGNCRTLKESFKEFKEIVSKTIIKAIIPLLPLYIFGIFLCMTYTGQAYRIMLVFVQIIVVIFVLHFFILIYQFCIAGALVKHNPFRLLWNMLPAYLTALGTASSAATIPVTLKCSLRNGVHEGIAGFVVPLCATIHMSGSAMKITACALTICLLHGMPHGFGVFLNFVMLLAIMMVAAPGVPGGAIMAALAPLASVLGFGATDQALMIALYIAMDSFGTACNVTGDGAIALVVDRYFKKTIA